LAVKTVLVGEKPGSPGEPNAESCPVLPMLSPGVGPGIPPPPQPTVTVIVPPGATGYSGIYINPPAPPPPVPVPPCSEPPEPPPATTKTSDSDVVPDGTLNVPDEVNDSDVNVLLIVILNALEVVFDAASTALNVKL